MKRKEYQKPAMQIVVLTRCSCLLQTSGEIPTKGGAGVENYGVEEEKDI